jgi:hypothetical protein
VFNLAQFLGELREGLPRLAFDTLTKAKFFRGLGSDYLNVEFGWKPFISDLQDAFSALEGASSVLFGPIGPVHRSRAAGDVYDQRSMSGTSVIPIMSTQNGLLQSSPLYRDFFKEFGSISGSTATTGNMTGMGTASFRSTLKTWFEGEFMLLPKAGFNPANYLDRLRSLMSTDITPALLWELSPWSWLVDWFLHIGDAIEAAQTATSNRIVSSYAYAMSEYEAVNAILLSNIAASGSRVYEGHKTTITQWTTLHRRRLRANPFGYSVNPTGSLNAGQWAILAALGFTKAGR